MNRIQTLLDEKKRILQTLLESLRLYRDRLDPKSESAIGASSDQKLDWVDELTTERESRMRMLQLVDQQIATECALMNPRELDELQGASWFKDSMNQILEFGSEIQLTDQSLFLYINHIGFEIRSQILKGLKEKEAISKFKSQGQSPSGEGLDQKA